MRCRLALTAFSLVALLASPARAQLADEQSRRDAAQFFQNGQELMSAEKFDLAADEFQKAIAKDRLMTVAHYELGQAYVGLQRYASAVQAYRKCLDASRELYDLQREDRFAVEKERNEMLRDMEDTLRRMQSGQMAGIGPTRITQMEAQISDLKRQRTSLEAPYQPPAEPLLALGSALFRDGHPDEAEVQWKAAIDSNPKLGQAHNNLAVIYMQAGRFDEAEQEVKLAEKNGVRVNPQFKDDLKQRRAGK